MPNAPDITPCPLAPALAKSIRGARTELTERWLERISARVSLAPNRVFPTDELLNHVPLLIDGIADYIEDPTREVAGEASVVGKAMELGALRHSQGFDEYQILKEFEILGGIIFAYLIGAVRTMDEPCGKDELLACGYRLFRAVAIIQEASIAHYLQQLRTTLAEREARLRGFNRALAHELKNEIGAVLGAANVLDIDSLAPEERTRLRDIVRRNAASMRDTLENLLELSSVERDMRQQRHVFLPEAVAESVRRLRDRSRAAGIEVRVAELPAVEVPAATVEVATTNYLSNAIKYSDPNATTRWVEIRGHLSQPGDDGIPEVVVEVCDNGIGVPEDQRDLLFALGFRAHTETVTGVEGTGLGLSIVHDAVSAIGGRVWAEFPPTGGACFAFALPARRSEDRPD
jgi:signal transduction histidine kinase